MKISIKKLKLEKNREIFKPLVKSLCTKKRKEKIKNSMKEIEFKTKKMLPKTYKSSMNLAETKTLVISNLCTLKELMGKEGCFCAKRSR